MDLCFGKQPCPYYSFVSVYFIHIVIVVLDCFVLVHECNLFVSVSENHIFFHFRKFPRGGFESGLQINPLYMICCNQ